jgi:hypothetical protein
MSDIFISYASADREKARKLAACFQEQGWTVWWDRVIPPGQSFDRVIEDALASAKCVVVLWSSSSVASSWVKNEAAEAMSRSVLVPILIEHAKVPLAFRNLQAADLTEWDGSNFLLDRSRNQESSALIQSITSIVDPNLSDQQEARQAQIIAETSAQNSPKAKLTNPLGLGAKFAVVVTIGLFIAAYTGFRLIPASSAPSHSTMVDHGRVISEYEITPVPPLLVDDEFSVTNKTTNELVMKVPCCGAPIPSVTRFMAAKNDVLRIVATDVQPPCYGFNKFLIKNVKTSESRVLVEAYQAQKVSSVDSVCGRPRESYPAVFYDATFEIDF